MTGAESSAQKKIVNRVLPIGIKTPVQFSDADGLFAMHTDPVKNIQDNFRNLLLTNHGERVGLYDFGANLRPLVFDLGKNDFDQEAIIRIKNAISKYMPFIEPLTFETFSTNSGERVLAKSGIRITYAIPRLNIIEKKIEVILYTGG
tara:strand:+ start:233 stop:673 length:441 start_codon:yes stop_codon:yes gene_type:complete